MARTPRIFDPPFASQSVAQGVRLGTVAERFARDLPIEGKPAWPGRDGVSS